MSKRKRQSCKDNACCSFHKDFIEPSDHDRNQALGPFPLPEKLKQPSSLWESTPGPLTLNDVDNPIFFQHVTKATIPRPTFELDWLAQVPETGQGLDEYVGFLTTKATGRLKPIANASGNTICLLPITSHKDSSSWPENQATPRLEELMAMTQTFFQRPVRILPSARLETRLNNQKKATFYFHLPQDASRGGATGAQKKSMMETRLPQGRYDAKSGRSQYQVISLLDALSWYRKEFTEQRRQDNFCIMGMTLEDLYDGDQDLFCAGMAFGGDKVALFSFHRYHPHLKMNPQTWWDYGYTPRLQSHAYLDLNKERPNHLDPAAPKTVSKATLVEYFRRCTKLLLHELGHLYGLDHCIHYQCLMMGTGHLVEDFAAPMHLCGICLRKLQWRLGFSVVDRYVAYRAAMRESCLTKEVAWVTCQLGRISKEEQNHPEKDKGY